VFATHHPSQFLFQKTSFSLATTIIMDSWKLSIEKFIGTPQYHDILSIIKGFRNGAVYGAKIRFPHALVMTFLFRNDP
jgi:hypothetical protein